MAMARAHRHQEVEINYLEYGEATYLIGGRLAHVREKRLSFFWGAIPHQLLSLSIGASGFWYVTVPLAWVLSWELPPRVLKRLMDGQLQGDERPRPGDPGRLTEWLDALNDPDPRAQKPVMLELEARFRRFALDSPRSTALARQVPSSAAALGRVERLARFIVEHYLEPLTLADIAGAVGVHPNYAANLFRRHCGQTLLQCLTQHRLAHAQRMLATSDEKVIDIAFASGFGSLSRFHEAFIAKCGVAPAAYRRRLSGQEGFQA